MKQPFIKLFSLLALTALISSCEKSELKSYDLDDMIYVYKEAYNTKKDSTIYSFAVKPNDLMVDTVKVAVRIMGTAKNVDREVKFASVPGATDAIEGTHYSFLPYVIPAGAYSADLPIVVKRTPDMKTQTFTLLLQVVESADFKPGVPSSPVTGNFAGASLQYLIRMNDYLTKPSNWDTQLISVFGTYSQVKYKFIIDVTGKTEFVTGAAPLMSFGELQYYKAYVKVKYTEYTDANGPLIDELGGTVTFP